MGMVVSVPSNKSVVVAPVTAPTKLAGRKAETIIIDDVITDTSVTQETATSVIGLAGEYAQGPRGDAATIRVGTVTEGDYPAVTNQGTDTDAVLNFVLQRGPQGIQGIQGPPGIGIQGPKGETGGVGSKGSDAPTMYTWVKYAANKPSDTSEPLTDDPTGMDWVGIAYNRLKTEDQDPINSNIYTNYKWSKIQGSDGQRGETGAPGRPGGDGVSLVYIGEFDHFPTHPEDLVKPLENGHWFFHTGNGRTYVYQDAAWYRMTESGGSGPIGPQGVHGNTVIWKGYTSAPPNYPEINWAYQDQENDLIYFFNGQAWVLMTFSGSDVEVVYHDNPVGDQPLPPTGDGKTGGWYSNPNEIGKGKINWLSQRYTGDGDGKQTWNGALYVTGVQGETGRRGTTTIMTGTETGNWDADFEQNILPTLVPNPSEWDVVTVYQITSPDNQTTKRYGFNTQMQVWEWLDYRFMFLGDVLVDGTVDGTAFNAKTTITAGIGNEIGALSGTGNQRIYAGHVDPEQAPFRVNQQGKAILQNADVVGRITATELVLGSDTVTGRDELIGDALRFIYKAGNEIPPSKPANGYPPSGWTTSPPDVELTEIIWACQAYFNGMSEQTGPWSSPYQFGGVSGGDGDTVFMEYQHAPTADGPWHSDFLTGDYWRRMRKVTNGIGEAWSEPALARQDGIDGYTPQKGIDYFDGTDGLHGAFHSYVFKSAATKPSTPSGGSYNGTTETFPSGWQDDPTFTKGQITWVSKRKYSHDGTNWSAPAWSEPTEYSVEGQAGDTIYVEYQHSIDGTSWHTDQYATDMYMRQRTVTNGEAGSWSQAVRIQGVDGQDGYTPVKGVDYHDGLHGSFHSYVYRTALTRPSTPSGGSYDGTNETTPSGWNDDPYFTDGFTTWVSHALYKHGSNGAWTKNGWSTPSEYSKQGPKGDAGETVFTEYQHSSDGTYWHSDLLPNDKYMRSRVVIDGVPDSWGATVEIRGNDGADGSNGQDGYTPQKGVDYFDGKSPTVVDNGNGSITVTDGDGNSVDIYDGADGKDGTPAPIPTVTDNGNGTVTINDGSGNTATVSDGYTPIKGKDYFDGSTGADGTHGDFVSFIYKKQSSKPSTPTGGSFNGSSETVPSGWLDTPPSSNQGETVWMSTVRYKNNTNGTWTRRSNWSTPAEHVYNAVDGSDGSDGMDGRHGNFHSYVFKASTSKPSTPSGGSFNGTTESVPSGWNDDPYFMSGKTTWVSHRIYTHSGSSWSGSSWSSPAEYSKQGIQGPTGATGTPGQNGSDGRTSYFHVAYADDAFGNGFSQSPTGKEYIGTYVDFSAADSSNKSAYSWALIKGQDGSQGIPGQNGEDGTSSYLHIAYANNSSGTSGFSTTVATNKLYMGQYVDSNINDSTDPSKYSWTLIKGEKGDKGNTGSTGPKGSTGSRGAGQFTRGVGGLSSWSNSQAALAVTDGVPVENDIVTLYNSSNKTSGYRETRKYNGSSWTGFALELHGDAFIEGTVVADEVRAGSIFGKDATFQGDVYAQNIKGDTYEKLTVTAPDRSLSTSWVRVLEVDFERDPLLTKTVRFVDTVVSGSSTKSSSRTNSGSSGSTVYATADMHVYARFVIAGVTQPELSDSGQASDSAYVNPFSSGSVSATAHAAIHLDSQTVTIPPKNGSNGDFATVKIEAKYGTGSYGGSHSGTFSCGAIEYSVEDYQAPDSPIQLKY